MRPVDLDTLLAQEKPRFIKKSERRKETVKRKIQQVDQTQRSDEADNHKDQIDQSDKDQKEQTEHKVEQRTSNKKTKFNFDWDQNEDTSLGFTPLIQLEEEVDELEPSVHWSQKPLDQMTSTDWRDLKDEFSIISKGTTTHPLRTWEESRINKQIIDILYSLSFSTPTPIQRASIPIALEEKDIIGIAETGSGKTVAYIVPLLNYILSIDKNYLEFEHLQEFNLNKPLGLILAPTRELANQISAELAKFCKKLLLTSVSIIGGHNYEETVNSLSNGVHIVVATPGRLIDSLERNLINLTKCHYVIFDEADRMIDMGFEKSLNSIYQYLPGDLDQVSRTTFNISHNITLMYTATFSPSIESLTKKYLNKPVKLVIGQVGEKVDNINQQFELLAGPKQIENKFNKLVKVIKQHISSHRHYSIIVFANYIKLVEELSEQLGSQGFDNITIHGSKSQQARERAIEEFRAGHKRILVATDVAARGIDIANVSLVINYQMSNKFDEYIHRIGRTGRAGNKGNSYTFLEDSNKEIFGELRKFLKRGIPSWLANYDYNGVIRE